MPAERAGGRRTRIDTGRRKELRLFAKELGLSIKNYNVLDRALTHASAAAEGPLPNGHYESLEFMGDAALGLAVAEHLYRTVPNGTPGEYSRMRAGVVNRRVLHRIARDLEIAPLIRLGKGEEATGGRSRNALLADCVEALIGAVYLDQGWEATQEFIERIFQRELERVRSSGKIWDFKSRLQQYCQAQRIALPEFSVIREAGPDHQKEFEVEVRLRGTPLGRGTGPTKKEAEQQAARAALEAEDQLSW